MDLDIAANIERLEEKIETACARAGRKRRELRLMAVSKFHPLEAVEIAWKAGLRLFGENRVKEAAVKYQDFRESRSGTEIHLIGSLQRNKAKTAAAFFDCIQSVDRDSLIEELGALTQGKENPLMILLELHTAEDTKSGFPDRDSLFRAADRILSFPGLKPAGLMTMAPFSADKTLIRSSFRELAGANDELKRRFPGTGNWFCLSMGMTNDYEIAIEEGSTLIRIGTAIFGERGI